MESALLHGRIVPPSQAVPQSRRPRLSAPAWRTTRPIETPAVRRTSTAWSCGNPAPDGSSIQLQAVPHPSPPQALAKARPPATERRVHAVGRPCGQARWAWHKGSRTRVGILDHSLGAMPPCQPTACHQPTAQQSAARLLRRRMTDLDDSKMLELGSLLQLDVLSYRHRVESRREGDSCSRYPRLFAIPRGNGRVGRCGRSSLGALVGATDAGSTQRTFRISGRRELTLI